MQDKRSRYRQGGRGCGPGPWPGCCCVLSPFVCGITEAWPPAPFSDAAAAPFGLWSLATAFLKRTRILGNLGETSQLGRT